MADTLREEFEAWTTGPEGAWIDGAVWRDSNGNYGEVEIAREWEIWQAATRAALASRPAEVDDSRAKADEELWETAMSHAAMYVENHCIDGEDQASHMMSMGRPEFGPPSAITTTEKRIAALEQENADLRFNIGELMKAVTTSQATGKGTA